MTGPKTDPCGAPNTSCDRDERTLWMDMHCQRPLRYDSNMRNTDPDQTAHHALSESQVGCHGPPYHCNFPFDYGHGRGTCT